MRTIRSIALGGAFLLAAVTARGAELRIPVVKARCGSLARVAFGVTASGPVANLQFDLAVVGAELVGVQQTLATGKWIVSRADEGGRTTIRMRGGPVDASELLGQIVLRVPPAAVDALPVRLSEIRAFGDGFGETAPDVTATVGVDCTLPPLVFRDFAGTPGGPGSRNGTAGRALLKDTRSIAIDAAGNLYVADSGNHAIRRVDARGEVITFAGRTGVAGHADGRGSEALFQAPRGIALAPDGSLVVADSGTQTIRRISPAGEVTTIAGKPGEQGSADGAARDARFCFPSAVAVAADGSVIVADTGYLNEPIYGLPFCGQTIRKIDPRGQVSTIAGSPGAVGLTDGPGAAARFSFPTGVAIAGDGSIWVGDTGSIHGRSYNGRTIRRIAPDGTVTTVAGRPDAPYDSGSIDGVGRGARFALPSQIVEDSDGSFVVADIGTIRRVTVDGRVTTIAGVPGASSGVAVGSDGSLFASDRNGAIWKLAPPAEPALVAGSRFLPGEGKPDREASELKGPSDVAIDRDGSALVADYGRIVRVTPDGRSSVVVPQSGASPFQQLLALAVDTTDGTIWAIDGSRVWKISPDGTMLRIGGANGWFGWADGGPDDAMFFWPQDLAVAADGTVIVADTNNHVLRRVTKDGMVTTIAGEHGINETLDGPVATARFNHPVGVAVGAEGAVWVTESWGQTVRLVAQGQVSTIAGTPGVIGDSDGKGSEARFAQLLGLAVDARGRAWVSDSTMIRIVERDGTVTTAAGGSSGFIRFDATSYSGIDGGLGSETRWMGASDLAFDANGRLFVVDGYWLKVGTPCFEGSSCGAPRARAARR
jgi:sugar lactone lactonase YvrE